MIDDLLTDLASSGWLVNNCYQPDAALWRVSLRRPDGDGDWFSTWAEGPTLVDALEDCIAKLNDAEFHEAKPLTFANEAKAPKQSLLSTLGLVKPITRRI